VHLILVGAIAELTALPTEMARLALLTASPVVQSTLLPTTELWIQQELEEGVDSRWRTSWSG